MALHLPRSVPDDADPNAVPVPVRVFGGHPSPLATEEARERVKAMIRSGQSCVKIAELLGYRGVSAFSQAFLHFCGMRPTEYAKQNAVPKPKRAEGSRRVVKRKPPHTGEKPLPRFDAKPKARKRAKRKAK